MDGSSGRTYEAASHPYYYLTATSSMLTIGTTRFSLNDFMLISWDLRVVDESNIIWTRPNKQREIAHFSDGAILFTGYWRGPWALKITENYYASARLSTADVGSYETRFHLVPGLSGKYGTISFRSIELEGYYLGLCYFDRRQNLCLKRFEISDEFKEKASYFPVAALDLSQGVSFISDYLRDSYLCIDLSDIQVRPKENTMKYSQQCCWDLRVLDKSGVIWSTNWEDLQYSYKGPDVVGEEMGIPLGSDLLHRANQVLTGNTLAWIEGLPLEAACTAVGERCSMGLVCKNDICQVLNSTLSNLPVESPPAHEPGIIGGVCDPNAHIDCVNGATCIKKGTKHYCTPSENQSVRFFRPSAYLKRLTAYYTTAQEVALLEAPNLESSVLNPDEYSTRGQSVIESMAKEWCIGLEFNEICEHEESRCTLGLVCKVANDNRRRCLEQ